MLNRFSAAVFAGTVTGPSGRVIHGGSSAVQARISETSQMSQASRLVLESTHFGWEGEHSFDSSFRAQLGLQPVLTLVSADLDEKPATGSAPPPATVAVLQPAIVTSIGWRAGFPLERIDGEISIAAHTGAQTMPSRLTTKSRR